MELAYLVLPIVGVLILIIAFHLAARRPRTPVDGYRTVDVPRRVYRMESFQERQKSLRSTVRRREDRQSHDAYPPTYLYNDGYSSSSPDSPSSDCSSSDSGGGDCGGGGDGGGGGD